MPTAPRIARAAAATLAVTVATAVAVGSPASPLAASHQQRPAQVADTVLDPILQELIDAITASLPPFVEAPVVGTVCTVATGIGSAVNC